MDFYKSDTGDGFIGVEYDEYSESPREWDNLGTFLTFESRRISPDKNQFKSGEDFCEHFGVKDIPDLKNLKNYLFMFVSRYEHGAVCYAATRELVNAYSDPWDSCICGVIYVSYEDLRKEYSVKNVTKKIKEIAYSVLEGEVKQYSEWANGEVFYVRIFNSKWEEIDSYGGCYGSDDLFAGYTPIFDSDVPDFVKA